VIGEDPVDLAHDADASAQTGGEARVGEGGLGVGVLEEVGGDQMAADALRGLLAQAPQLLVGLLVELAAGDALGHARLDRPIGTLLLARTAAATVLTAARVPAPVARAAPAVVETVLAAAAVRSAPTVSVVAARPIITAGPVVTALTGASATLLAAPPSVAVLAPGPIVAARPCVAVSALPALGAVLAP